MRTVSFVEHLEFEINGNVFSKAIALGDVDNDKVNSKIAAYLQVTAVSLSLQLVLTTRDMHVCFYE